jgi:hypothetical protein
MPPYFQTVLIRQASAKCGKLQTKQLSFGHGGGGARKQIVLLLVFNDLNNLYTLSVQEAFMKTKDVMSVSIFSTCVGNLRTRSLELLNF